MRQTIQISYSFFKQAITLKRFLSALMRKTVLYNNWNQGEISHLLINLLGSYQMNSPLLRFLLTVLPLLFLCSLSSLCSAGISFNQNKIDVVFPPSCNHTPINIPYTIDSPFDESILSVSSDSTWAIPSINSASDSIDVSFQTENLFASYSATISVNDGVNTIELFIQANVPAMSIYRLLDDPIRSKTYGIQKDGTNNGSIIAFDPVQETLLSCTTVGKDPTDFVINSDSSELLVINSIDETISVIDLESFTYKETIQLPTYVNWGDAGETAANIDLGADGIIYYTDGAWAPKLHVLNRETGTVLQSTTFNDSMGFMDFAITSDKTKLVAMPQYGWSAGSHTAIIGHFTINNDGTIHFIKQTDLPSFSREPFEAPVLIRDDNKIAVLKTIATDPSDTDSLDRVFPSTIWSMNPNASVVATGDKLYEYKTGNELYSIPNASITGSGYLFTKAQAFTSDFTRFVYFNPTDRTLNVVNLINEIGLELLGRTLSPANGTVINSPDSLTWAPLSGVSSYDVYLGTNQSTISNANINSASYLGRITGTSTTLINALNNSTEYFWRVDPVTASGPETGTTYSFTVSQIALDKNEIDAQTVTGHADYQVNIALSSESPEVSWNVSSPVAWISFTENAGSTPSTLSVHLDATSLRPGFHQSSITLTSEDGALTIPVQLQIDTLKVTHIRSDRNSEKAYIISEDTSNALSKAYLLEVDTLTEKIQRVKPVGSSVTDAAIHYPDNLIYITNWKSGNLLAIDKESFSQVKTIAFEAAGATGYSEGDVYRVAAGASERIVVEEEDQWIDISIFNTKTETRVDTDFVREGGGAFDPTGRYYYHGDNNSSGANILKYDTSGDTFTKLIEVRPEGISSYYGSRTIIVSEDGSRIFWAGAVLDQNLDTVWGLNDIIYSASKNGLYAIGSSAIYDTELRRQILTLPTTTNISGYNSTSEKLITQVENTLAFYALSTPIVIPAPILTVSEPSYSSLDLTWTDKSLEMEFIIQQRKLGSNSWKDIHTTDANVIAWTANNLEESESYEFRVRASSPDYSSPWSNIALGTVLTRPNEAPIAHDDQIMIFNKEDYRFSVTENDTDYDGEIDLNSITINIQANFGEVIIHDNGDVTYRPGSDFFQRDEFSYTIQDDDGATSFSANVVIIYNPAPVLSTNSTAPNSIELNWTDNNEETYFAIQQRITGDMGWPKTQYVPANATHLNITELQEGESYEFRVRAIADGFDSPWSNISTARIPTLSNEAPITSDDIIMLPNKEDYRFNITTNDIDNDGALNYNSIEIVSPPQYGQAILHSNGDVTFTPNSDFVLSDTFTYTVEDDKGAVSLPSTVTVIFFPAPTLSISKISSSSVELIWADENEEESFSIQQRVLGSNIWLDIEPLTENVENWTANNLTPESTYEFRIRAESTDYDSPWSNIAIATTPKAAAKSNSSGGSFGPWALLIFGLIAFISRRKNLIDRKVKH